MTVRKSVPEGVAARFQRADLPSFFVHGTSETCRHTFWNRLLLQAGRIRYFLFRYRKYITTIPIYPISHFGKEQIAITMCPRAACIRQACTTYGWAKFGPANTNV